MTIFYLLLALALAVGLNHPSRLWRVMAQLVAVSALGLMAFSIWLANVDGTFAARPAADLRPALLNAMAAVALFVVLLLLALLPVQWSRLVEPVPDWNQRQRWGQIARILHWTSAVLMLAALPMGLFVAVLHPAVRADFQDAHIGIGIAVFGLLLLRLLTQRASPGPASPNGAARLNKLALYLLLATLPVSGLLLAGATGAPVLGLHAAEAVPLPLARLLHQWLSGLFALAFAAHAGAVVWHHFVLRDRQLIRRMLR
ncbi:cytochrome b/b6 domain-containing protein [Sandarakinorhabdus oryzae]|uniref:cytochrome b/b6 domain-containing protein n=1 Tax=Sandarakinorhabdus oryzae TaxID=2675220 RepID=UPI0012E28D82|nr:cytochrome b/b6 domain-containing protein [Sandarakinorhabdus oryzae]